MKVMLFLEMLFTCIFFSILSLCNAESITYGSTVKLADVNHPTWFLYSLEVQWSGGPSGENIVTVIEETANPQVYWSVYGSNASGEPIACNANIVLRHAASGKSLKVSKSKSRLSSRDPGVVADIAGVLDGDVFTVECDSDEWKMNEHVRFKHAASGLYLKISEMYTQYNCPRCPIVGQKEVTVGDNRSQWSVEGGVILKNTQEVKDDTRDDNRDEDDVRDEL